MTSTKLKTPLSPRPHFSNFHLFLSPFYIHTYIHITCPFSQKSKHTNRSSIKHTIPRIISIIPKRSSIHIQCGSLLREFLGRILAEAIRRTSRVESARSRGNPIAARRTAREISPSPRDGRSLIERARTAIFKCIGLI